MRWILSVMLGCLLANLPATSQGESLQLNLRSRYEAAVDTGRYHAITTPATWKAEETAIVVCDMWNSHDCVNAVTRVEQLAPRMNEVLKAARAKGALIVHAPSDTMSFYKDHPGRKLAMSAPKVEPMKPLQQWCFYDSQKEGPLAADHLHGDCEITTPRKQGEPYPWTRQISTLEIMDGDAITDSIEAYYLFRQKGIKNMIIMGVHTNACVLGRPFGIRQMVNQGINVALMRDMTDAMYKPPYTSHFTGVDLIVEHIEKYWCPTLLSTDLIDGKEFRFPDDKRPHVVMIQGEDEYQTAVTLPKFALEQLGEKYKISFVWLDEKTKQNFPGIDVVNGADVVLISARRHPIPAEELNVLKKHVAAGKPVVGIRTANHAFHLRNKPAPDGLTDWPDLDADVFGGSYTDHYSDRLKPIIQLPASHQDHSILKGVPLDSFTSRGSLYQTRPLHPGTVELLQGQVEGVEESQPVAWTFQRADGGKSFYTSLGHPGDFDQPAFITLLKNAIDWAAETPQKNPTLAH